MTSATADKRPRPLATSGTAHANICAAQARISLSAIAREGGEAAVLHGAEIMIRAIAEEVAKHVSGLSAFNLLMHVGDGVIGPIESKQARNA